MSVAERQAPELQVHRAAQAVGCRNWPENLVRLPALVRWLPFAWVSDAATIA